MVVEVGKERETEGRRGGHMVFKPLERTEVRIDKCDDWKSFISH